MRSTSNPEVARRMAILRALRRHRARLGRKVEAMRGDLAEAQRAEEFRRCGEALLAFLHQVPARTAVVTLPDPSDAARTLTIALEPSLKPHANAARYFKRAGRAERGLRVIPPRLAAVVQEAEELDRLLERAGPRAESERDPTPGADPVATEATRGDSDAAAGGPDHALAHDLERAFDRLPAGLKTSLPAPGGRTAAGAPKSRPVKPTVAAIASGGQRAPSARLQPRRLRSKEGWDVLIGRNNQGNDYLTHHLARSEDYWFHVRGASGSHVVLRRGKGKNEPSKQTLEEVAAWAAHYSQARTAGRVPVIVTRKKYVRKPKKAPAGLAVCEREKILIVRPREPERKAIASEAGD